MATNAVEKGLTITFDGDFSKMQSAIDASKKSVKSYQDELKQVNKLLKFDPENTTLLTQKQQLLSQQISEVKNRLTAMLAEQEKVNAAYEAGEIPIEDYRAFQREVEAAKNYLGNLEGQLDQVDQALANSGVPEYISDLDKLKATIQEQENELEKLKEAYTNVVLTQGENSDEAQELATKITSLNGNLQTNKTRLNEAQDAAKGLASGQTEAQSSTEKLKSTIKDQEAELAKLKSKYEDVVLTQGKGSTEAKELADKIQTLNNELQNNKNRLKDVESATEDLTQDHKSLAGAFQEGFSGANILQGGITGLATAFGEMCLNAIKSCIGAIKDFVDAAIEVGSAFDTSMSNVEALQKAAGATDEQIQMLRDTAKEMGSTTQFSATDASDALGLMALAGWDAEKSAANLPGILQLAAASGMELADAANIVTSNLGAFSRQELEASQMADILAYTQANTQTTTAQLGEAFKTSAARMGAAGQTCETTSALLGALANQNSRGAEAGTKLNAMLRDMTSKMEDGKLAIGNTTVAITDQEGNYRNLIDIVADMTKATEGMGDAQKAAALKTALGSDEGADALNRLMMEGTDSLKKLENSLQECGGTAQEMADVMNDNLAGDQQKFASALEGLQIQLYESIEPVLRACTQWFTDVIDGINGFMTSMESIDFSDLQYAWEVVWNAIQTVWDAVAQPIIDAVAGWVEKAVNLFQEKFPQIGDTFHNVMETVENWWAEVGEPTFQAVKTVVETVMGALGLAFDNGLETVSFFIDGITSFMDAIMPVINGVINTVGALLRGDWEQAWASGTGAVSDFVGNIGGWLSDMVGRFFEYCGKVTENVLKWFGELVGIPSDEMQKFIDNICIGIEKLPETFKEWLDKAIEKVREWGADLVESAGKVGEFFDAVIEWFEKLPENIASWFNETIEKVKTWAGELFTNGQQAGENFLQSVVDFFQNLPERVGHFIGQALGTVVKWGIDLVQKATETGTNFFNSVSEWFQKLPDEIAKWATETYNNVVQWGTDLWNSAVETCTSFFNSVSEWFQKLPGEVSSWIDQALANVAKWGTDMWNKAKESCQKFFNSVSEWFQKLPGEIKLRIDRALMQVTQWAHNLADKGKEAASDLCNNVVDGLANLPSKILEIGSNIVSGLWDGIQSGAGWLWDNISNFCSGIVDGFCDALSIFSPSRVMRDKVGRFIPAGIGAGIEANADSALDAVDDLADDVAARASGIGDEIRNGLQFERDLNASFNHTIDGGVNPLDEIKTLTGMLSDYLPALLEAAKKSIVLDDGTLVGKMAPAMDKELEFRRMLSDRGVLV